LSPTRSTKLVLLFSRISQRCPASSVNRELVAAQRADWQTMVTSTPNDDMMCANSAPMVALPSANGPANSWGGAAAIVISTALKVRTFAGHVSLRKSRPGCGCA
jgi:hypothetical protein